MGATNVIREIKRATRRKFSAEEKIRIVVEGLRGEIPVSALCAGVKVSPQRCTTDGPKPSWRRARTG